MSSFYGNNLKLSIFGQSHGRAIGMTLDGIPAGLTIDEEQLLAFLRRRAPGSSHLTTSRKEADIPAFLSGVVDGRTCGAPIAAVIYNENVRRGDYADFSDTPRPGHADFTAQIKHKGYQDASGGGHFSGRLTAPLCIAGGLCKQWLAQEDIHVEAKILSVGKETDPSLFERTIQEAKSHGNSIGAVIGCTVTGVPAGLGDGMFGGMESRLAPILFGIPGVKGLEFGSGFAAAQMLGSEANDAFAVEDGKIITKTNHCGGILGGITNGMPLTFRVAMKPTPSIAKPQESVSLSRMEPTVLKISGRHDPCIGLRAVPVVEAAAAIAIFDALL